MPFLVVSEIDLLILKELDGENQAKHPKLFLFDYFGVSEAMKK
jgi:hypothetical protein